VRAVGRIFDRELPIILSLTVIAVGLAAIASTLFVVQDTWLDLVGGRQVYQHGLPNRDTLTLWTHGVRWIDEQWLAQLSFYALASLGGIQLLLIWGAVLVMATLLMCAIAARRLGGSPSMAAACLWIPVVVAIWLVFLRAQIFALPLFVLLYWLLASDARRPSFRVLLALPILVVWANLHGSVALAAGLTVVAGLFRAIRLVRSREHARREWLVPVLLAACPPIALFASPYGFALASYYRLILSHPALPYYVIEWKPAWVSYTSVPFALVALGVAAVLAMRWRRISAFECVALAILLLGALLAIRNIVWFGLAAAISLPGALQGDHDVVRESTPVRSRVLVAAAALLVWPLVFLTVPNTSHVRAVWPRAGSTTVASAVSARDGSRLVLADHAHADWLLWEEPSLTGLVAFDGRFELMTPGQVHGLSAFLTRSNPTWRRIASGYRILTFDPQHERPLEQAFLRDAGARLLYQSDHFAVVVRPD